MNAQVSCLACDNAGTLYAGGYFTNAGGISANYIAQWNGSAWAPLGSGMSGGVYVYPRVGVLAFDNFGKLYAGGSFAMAGGVTVNQIAMWNGSVWAIARLQHWRRRALSIAIAF